MFTTLKFSEVKKKILKKRFWGRFLDKNQPHH